jgi:putative transposase
MRTDLVLDALRMALGTRAPGADFTLVTHTDQGSQYTSHDCTQVIDDHKVLASVGSVGDAYDNPVAESFVDTFKTELIKDRVWRTRSQMELAILEYVAWFTTTACTNRSVTSRRWSSKTPTRPGLRPLRGRL